MNRASFSTDRTIGEGGTGTVKVVWHPEFEGPVALKHLNVNALVGPERDRNIRRFQTEVKLLREKLNHPNVITILYAELAGDDPWFVMPLAEASLADKVPHGGLQAREVRDVFSKILAALVHAHERGVLHRDLKPHNILLIDGTPVVSDFGLGRSLDSKSTRLTTSSYFGGTAGYAAPEQMTDFEHADERADIYGLGCLLYFMTTGDSPEYYDARRIPVEYRRIIARCRQRNPDDRFQSVRELQGAFSRLWETRSHETPRVEQAHQLIAVAADAESRQVLVSLYLSHPDDTELYSATLPAWPQDLIDAQVSDDPRETGEIVAAFCAQLPGQQPFDFLDTAASFLRRVFLATEEPELRELILDQLLQLAMRGNRWAVGRILVGLISGAQSPTDMMIAEDLLGSNPQGVAWLSQNVEGAENVPIIARAIQSRKAVENIEERKSPAF